MFSSLRKVKKVKIDFLTHNFNFRSPRHIVFSSAYDALLQKGSEKIAKKIQEEMLKRDEDIFRE